MTDIEKYKLAMYEAVLLFLSENQHTINNIRAFSWAIIKLRRTIDQIKHKEKDLYGQAFENRILSLRAKDELILAVFPLMSALFGFAKETNNLPLKKAMGLTQSSMNRLLDCDLIDKAINTGNLARKYKTELKRFGINSSDLKLLKTKTNSFKYAINNKVANCIPGCTLLAISNLFADADKILNSYMDGFAEALSNEYPDFYCKYLQVRDVAHQAKKRKLLELEDED